MFTGGDVEVWHSRIKMMRNLYPEFTSFENHLGTCNVGTYPMKNTKYDLLAANISCATGLYLNFMFLTISMNGWENTIYSRSTIYWLFMPLWWSLKSNNPNYMSFFSICACRNIYCCHSCPASSYIIIMGTLQLDIVWYSTEYSIIQYQVQQDSPK